MRIDWPMWMVLGITLAVLVAVLTNYSSLQATISGQQAINKAVLDNKQMLHAIDRQMAQGARFTACDGKEMADQLRAQGLALTPANFETLCKK